MRFPSVEWFQALEAEAEKDPARRRRLGFCDATVGINILADIASGEDRGYLLRFDGYRCKAVEETGEPETIADFVLEAPRATWQEMIENIRASRGADLHHTLNYLTLPGDPIKLTAADQLKRDLFFRYNQTLQEFFDGSQRVQTEFAA